VFLASFVISAKQSRKYKDIFGLLIKEIRREKSISQEELAAKTGLDRSFISLVENGKRNPTLTTVIKLSQGLEIGLSDLMVRFEAIYSENEGGNKTENSR